MAEITYCYLNGEYLPLQEARISVLDRGFLFGDGIYEVIPVYQGYAFRLQAHLQRLAFSLDAVRIANPYSEDGWRERLQNLIERHGALDMSLYLQITRGVQVRRDHAIATGSVPTVFAMISPLQPPAPALLEDGIAAVTHEDIRWQRCDIKAITLLANVLLRDDASRVGAAEVILIRDGWVTEGGASNVFMVIDGQIHTPRADHRILAGITRDLVLELARASKLTVHERNISQHELTQAQEIWIASSTRELLAVTHLDQQPVGAGRPGPLWRRMHHLLQAYKQQWLLEQVNTNSRSP